MCCNGTSLAAPLFESIVPLYPFFTTVAKHITSVADQHASATAFVQLPVNRIGARGGDGFTRHEQSCIHSGLGDANGEKVGVLVRVQIELAGSIGVVFHRPAHFDRGAVFFGGFDWRFAIAKCRGAFRSISSGECASVFVVIAFTKNTC